MRLQAGIIHIGIILVVFASLLITVGYWLFRTNSSEFQQITISPYQMLPYVTHSESRKNICAMASLPELKEICDTKYDSVNQDETEKIDKLFQYLDKLENDKSIPQKHQYLISTLVFSTLPTGASNQSLSLVSEVRAQGDTSAGVTQSEYADFLADDLVAIMQTCPSEGNENWAMNVMCSSYTWSGNEQLPIYSKQYSESGGPCMFSDAGAVEAYSVHSRTNSKMRSEYDFTDANGVSSQIACSFSCVSFNCPKHEDEFVNPYCDARGSQNIYVKHPYTQDPLQLTSSQRSMIAETGKAECEERSYDYFQKPDGTTGQTKVRDCKILGGGRGDSKWNDYNGSRRLDYYSTYCCSCERQKRDNPFISEYDFTDPDYSGGDLVTRILDVAREKVKDIVQTPNPVENTTPPSTPEPTQFSDNTPSPDESAELILVLVIGGEHYPFDQFELADPDVCDARHWHANGLVTSLEGSTIEDPNPNGCGFGKEGEISIIEVGS